MPDITYALQVDQNASRLLDFPTYNDAHKRATELAGEGHVVTLIEVTDDQGRLAFSRRETLFGAQQ